MHIQLSPMAIKNARVAAQQRNKTPQEFINEELEKILSEGSAYFVLTPAPPVERIRDMKIFVEEVSKMDQYFGFRFLTQEESSQLVAAMKQQMEEAAAVAEKSNILEMPNKEEVPA